jgi:Rrf2 family protein
LRITHEADYAVRIVYVLMQSEEPCVAASKLAEGSGVTLRFTLKILRKLAGSGIVTAQKGANGGYALAMDPAEVSLGLIIESIDGPFELNHCLSDDFDCTRVKDKKFCEFHHIFDSLNAKLKAELYSIKMNTFKTQK